MSLQQRPALSVRHLRQHSQSRLGSWRFEHSLPGYSSSLLPPDDYPCVLQFDIPQRTLSVWGSAKTGLVLLTGAALGAAFVWLLVKTGGIDRNVAFLAHTRRSRLT